MPSTNAVKLRQHTEAEWEDVRPIIERLYLRELRPLSSVIRTMEMNHQFKASTSMYKRRFRAWGLHKNSRYTTRTPLRTASAMAQASGTPRYLPQNVTDESLHTMLDLFTPWIVQANLLWTSAKHMHCPPRAAFIYGDFTHSIAVAVTAFESGDVAGGGATMRQAFVDLEHTLVPRAQSTFTLHSLFFALAILSQAGLFEISRLLLTHATNLVVSRLQRDVGRQNSVQGTLKPGQNDTPDNIYDGRHESHPLPQILKRLRLLSAELQGDSTKMTKAVFLAWSVYQQTTSSVSARSVCLQVSQREFWNSILKAGRSTMILTKKLTATWMDGTQPVLHYLQRLFDDAETNVDDDISLLYLNEIISIYSFSGCDKFEETALELLARAEKKSESDGEDKATILQWGANASLELASYYKEKGDYKKAIEYIGRLVPDSAGTEWETVLMDELVCQGQG